MRVKDFSSAKDLAYKIISALALYTGFLFSLSVMGFGMGVACERSLILGRFRAKIWALAKIRYLFASCIKPTRFFPESSLCISYA